MKPSARPGARLITLQGTCASSPQQLVLEEMVQCPAPRPQVCTMQCHPLRALLESGAWEQYCNGCAACCYGVVSGYPAGACEQSVH